MSNIQVDQGHSLGVEAAKKKLEGFAEEIKSKYGMTLTWKGDEADLKGIGASGSVKVTPSNVTVIVKLGMMAKAAGVKPDKVQDSISKRLKVALETA